MYACNICMHVYMYACNIYMYNVYIHVILTLNDGHYLQGFSQNLHAVFCLAENSVGPLATRPDDVHTLYSGIL